MFNVPTVVVLHQGLCNSPGLCAYARLAELISAPKGVFEDLQPNREKKTRQPLIHIAQYLFLKHLKHFQ